LKHDRIEKGEISMIEAGRDDLDLEVDEMSAYLKED